MLRNIAVLISALLLTSLGPAQTAAPFTITKNVRLVITDVEVTDSAGHPVHGLPESAFHLTDDGHPQQLRSFREQLGVTAAPPPASDLPAGVVSDRAQTELPPTVNVLLIDPYDTVVTDQMYLRIQLLKALERLQGQTVAVVAINSGHGALLLQGFTADGALLRAAVERELPRLVQNGGGTVEHFDDIVNALVGLSSYLSGVPGHKNLLWFSTNFPLVQQTFGSDNPSRVANGNVLTHLYNQLSLDRVSVYPINTAGPEVNPSVTVVGQGQPHGAENGGAGGDAGGVDISVRSAAGGRDITGEAGMDSLAGVTGGQAFYDRNDLGHVVETAVHEGSDYYTLTYAPTPFTADNTFHKVVVQIDGGPYTLRYRSGYVAFTDLREDQNGSLSQHKLAAVNNDLDTLASGGQLAPTRERHSGTDHLTDYTRPEAAQPSILFEARIVPAKDVAGWQVQPPARDRKGRLIENPHDAPYVIEYGALAHDVDFVQVPGGKSHAELIAAALAYDDSGYSLGTAISRVGVTFSPAQMQLAAHIGVPLRQQIRLPRKNLFVALSLIDGTNGHTGSVQIPFSPPQK